MQERMHSDAQELNQGARNSVARRCLLCNEPKNFFYFKVRTCFESIDLTAKTVQLDQNIRRGRKIAHTARNTAFACGRKRRAMKSQYLGLTIEIWEGTCHHALKVCRRVLHVLNSLKSVVKILRAGRKYL